MLVLGLSALMLSASSQAIDRLLSGVLDDILQQGASDARVPWYGTGPLYYGTLIFNPLYQEPSRVIEPEKRSPTLQVLWMGEVPSTSTITGMLEADGFQEPVAGFSV